MHVLARLILFPTDVEYILLHVSIIIDSQFCSAALTQVGYVLRYRR